MTYPGFLAVFPLLYYFINLDGSFHRLKISDSYVHSAIPLDPLFLHLNDRSGIGVYEVKFLSFDNPSLESHTAWSVKS
jgi:hypothetical protein